MRRPPLLHIVALAGVFVAIALIGVHNVQGRAANALLNVSYDPTRELYRDIDAAFEREYTRKTGLHIDIRQSHGGSSRQARSVISGEQAADVVTLGLFSDVDALRQRGVIADGWADRLPHHSQPYYSTIVFVVRKGNPRHIRDWPDLVGPATDVVTPNPRTSGNGKLSILAAWGSVIVRGGNDAQARDFLSKLYTHVVKFDAGARGAATTFALEKTGDVQLAWENEALREVADNPNELELVYPPVSILAEPYVAWVDTNTARHHTEATARAYLEFLFTDEAQRVIASAGYRPFDSKIAQEFASRLPSLQLFRITTFARDWDDANHRFFDENGIFDAVSDSGHTS